MLKIIPVTLIDLSIDSLLDPGDLVNHRVVVMLHELYGKAILCVDDPEQQEAVCLQAIQRNVFDDLVTQLLVSDGDTAGRVSRSKLPGRISHNDVEQSAASDALLVFDKAIPVNFFDAFAQWDRPELLDVLLLLELSELSVVRLWRDVGVGHASLKLKFVFGILLVEELFFEYADVMVDLLEHLAKTRFILGQIVDENGRVCLSTLIHHVSVVVLVKIVAFVLVDYVHRILFVIDLPLPHDCRLLQHIVRVCAVVRIIVLDLIIWHLLLSASLLMDSGRLIDNLLLSRVSHGLILSIHSFALANFLGLRHEVLLLKLLSGLRILLSSLHEHVLNTALGALVIIQQLAVVGYFA